MLDKFLPPHDNLYKFIAISGLMFIVLSFFPRYLEFKVGEMKIEYLKNLEVYTLDYDKFNEDFKLSNEAYGIFNSKFHELVDQKAKLVEALGKIPNDHTQQHDDQFKETWKSILENEKEINILLPEGDESNKRTAELKQKYTDFQKKKVELDETNSMLDYYGSGIFELNLYSWILAVAGFMFTVLGFYWWYVKIQKPADAQLIKDAQEKPKRKKPSGLIP